MSEFREVAALPFAVAQLARGALDAAGIEARVERHALASVYGLDTGAWAARVLVPAGDLPAARAVLAELEA
ncbi:MAG: DUF2007 domain-containing protein [Actinobacteria bacterium]|nr:DUF2007 domain-containing protein [Actinomycetota bacterium]